MDEEITRVKYKLKPGETVAVGEGITLRWTGRTGIGRRVELQITKPAGVYIKPVKQAAD